MFRRFQGSYQELSKEKKPKKPSAKKFFSFSIIFRLTIDVINFIYLV